MTFTYANDFMRPDTTAMGVQNAFRASKTGSAAYGGSMTVVFYSRD